MKPPALILLGIATSLLFGCASFKQKFRNRTSANIGFFADSTITMLSDQDMAITREEMLLVRRFYDEHAKEEQRVTELNNGLKKMIRGLVRYSIEIVDIAESDQPEELKIEAYADYISQFRAGMLEYEIMDSLSFDGIILEVREQTEFLIALRKAQVILNAAVMTAAVEIDTLIEATETLSEKIDTLIDNEYEDIIRYRQKLEREKFDILTAFEIIYDAFRDEEPRLTALRESGVIWTPEILPEGRPERSDLEKIGEHLKARMDVFAAVHTTLQPNWDDYLAAQRELDVVTDKSIAGAKRARILLLTWARAHQKMTSGKVDPAEWFDIGTVSKQLIMAAPSSLN